MVETVVEAEVRGLLRGCRGDDVDLLVDLTGREECVTERLLGFDVFGQDLGDLERVGVDRRPGVFQRDTVVLRDGLGVLVRILLGPVEDACDASEQIGECGPAVRVVERLVGCYVVVVDLVDRRNALGDDAGPVLDRDRRRWVPDRPGIHLAGVECRGARGRAEVDQLDVLGCQAHALQR